MKETVDPTEGASILDRLPSQRSSGLWTVAYCSRMAVPLSDDELGRLAIHADIRNRTLDIVGVLFVAGGRFLQVLEGEWAAVRWLYDVITEDPRHRRVTKLMDMPIERRAFDGWSMRLVCDTDLADDSRLNILRSLETAKALDGDDPAECSGLGELRSLPAALVGAVLGRAGEANSVERLAG